MASNITYPTWSVKIIGIPVTVTSTQLSQELRLSLPYRINISKNQNNNNDTQYGWVNNFVNQWTARSNF